MICVQEENDPTYLGVAKEESRVGFLSKLFFTWVDPLVVKAARGGLHQPDDVFDLPESLSPHIVAGEVRRETDRLIKLDTNTATEPGQAGEVKLLTLLYNCYGREFFRIGFLKFLSDCAGFAGPILLNCVVSFMEDQVDNIPLSVTTTEPGDVRMPAWCRAMSTPSS